MSALRWFRAYSGIVDDDKLRLLAFEDRWHFVALCALKCSGLLDEPDSPLRDRKIAVKLGVQTRELEEIARRLQEVELIDENLNPCKWDELQYRSDTSTDRVQKHREKQRGNGRKRCGNVSVTPPETETDTEKKEPNGSYRPWSCPPGVDPAHWRDLLKNRKTKRLTNTETAYTDLLADLDRLADDEWPPPRLVKHAAAKGWGAIHDPRKSLNGAQNGRPAQDGLSPTTRASLAVFGG